MTIPPVLVNGNPYRKYSLDWKKEKGYQGISGGEGRLLREALSSMNINPPPSLMHSTNNGFEGNISR
jgi:hypothetical protein